MLVLHLIEFNALSCKRNVKMLMVVVSCELFNCFNRIKDAA